MIPCIMITIGDVQSPRICSCTENYRQCSPTQCCSHKSFRSMKSVSFAKTSSDEAVLK